MRHNNKINHLGRTYSHRAAMLSNMAVSLIMHKRIFTTVAKAKELRKYVEPLITKCKTDSVHSRRVIFQELHDKYAVSELFREISLKIGDRPGGYTRIIKTGNRLGDNASMCFIELVDYNELMVKDAKKSTKTRRSRRGGSKAKDAVAATPAPKAEAQAEVPTPAEEPIVVEETAVVEETPAAAPETATEASVEEVPATEPVAETTAEEAPKAE
ncbi:MAG: 50S ribosomal protein L17 [Candidatus Symbiothrix sp.]|jgi:large subunit ribosomal protein L17|nr:50S ribosomal protein L17 [Candidatus Symbiothrix sp.]